MVIIMGMSEELYHRVVKVLTDATSEYPFNMDYIDVLDDFCAWYETNGGN